MVRSENSGPSFYFNWSKSKPYQNVVKTFCWMGINYIRDKLQLNLPTCYSYFATTEYDPMFFKFVVCSLKMP